MTDTFFEEAGVGAPPQEAVLIPARSPCLQDRVTRLLTAINNSVNSANHAKVELGTTLLEVRSGKVWKDWGFPTFGGYIRSISSRLEKGRSQLYGCIGLAEKLLPVLGAELLVQIPYTKAMELKKCLALEGRSPSGDLLKKAVDKSVGLKEFKAAAAEEYQGRPKDEKGKWYDLDGFYVTPEEQAELEYAFSLAARTDPVTKADLPAWAQAKDIMLKLARDYAAGHAAEVEQGAV